MRSVRPRPLPFTPLPNGISSLAGSGRRIPGEASPGLKHQVWLRSHQDRKHPVRVMSAIAANVNHAIESQRAAAAVSYIMGVLFCFGILYLAGLAQWMVWKRITREVNQHLPDSEQYSTSMWAFQRSARAPVNQFKIWQLHRQFYRESYLRLLFLATLVVMILFFGLTVLTDVAATKR